MPEPNPTIIAALETIHKHGTEQTLTRLTKPDTLTVPQLAPLGRTYASALHEVQDEHDPDQQEGLLASTLVAAIILGIAIHAHHTTKSPTRDPVLGEE